MASIYDKPEGMWYIWDISYSYIRLHREISESFHVVLITAEKQNQ